MAGTLILCATPIGNLGDAPPRLAAALAAASVVYAEDTRRARTLLEHLGVAAELKSYFAGNEDKRAREAEELLGRGETVAVVTDAGTPAISDPGLSLVRAAHRAEAAVTVIPGPSAVTAALAVSGLPADRFVFEGFLPRKGGDRRARLESLAGERRTAVVYCSPRRVVGDLEDLAGALGAERRVVVCRELTKLHEEVWAGSLDEAVTEWGGRESIKGELTLVLEGAAERAPNYERAVDEVRRRVARGVSHRDAVKQVAGESGLSRRRLYELSSG